jgi:Family of unknown function (DUF5320)
MPGGDRTGPLGAGPRTGRGMGYCSDYDRPGLANPAPGLRGRFGLRGGGMGGGWRRRLHASYVPGRAVLTPEQEAADLKAQAEWLKGQLDAIQKRIEEITT